MYPRTTAEVIDLSPQLLQIRRSRRRARLHTVLALWTQYAAIGALLLYGALRLLISPGAAPGAYRGPLALLWPASFLLLLVSYASDLLLWPTITISQQADGFNRRG